MTDEKREIFDNGMYAEKIALDLTKQGMINFCFCPSSEGMNVVIFVVSAAAPQLVLAWTMSTLAQFNTFYKDVLETHHKALETFTT